MCVNHSRQNCFYSSWNQVYASVLALITLVSHRWWSIARLHLNVIMLSVAAVYTYRDLLPLTMFNLTPMDSGQGWLLWSRLSIVLFVGVLCPLITPRIYTPVDPLNPEKEVNSELTASWLSFLTYTFMDPLILLAARSSHLAYESLPPLADYDRAEYLVQKSEKILDPYLRRKRTHLFWGLIRFFASEYIRLIIMITLKCLTGFLPPLAVNKVLQYLETGGKDAIVRPWVWIFLLFVGPTLGSISMQYYIFLATRTLVRTEGILTQLVFDHSLRIRMKEETEVTSTPTTVATTPDTRSIAETDATEIGAGSSDGCEDTLQESGNMSTASLAQSVAKGKRKAANISCAISAVPTPGPDGAKPVEAKASNLVGKINNFVSTDLGNITDGRDFLFIAWYGPLQLAICIWFLYAVLGWSALVGMGVMLISVPLPGYVAKLLNGVQTQRMQKTDARVQAVTETLSVIRMIKLFGWETKVNEQIAEKREVELGLLKKRRLLDLLNSNLNYFFPLLTMLVTFACYTIIQKEVLSASKLFSSIAVFDQLRDCLHGTFFMLPMIINAKVSLGRINDFLLNTELLDRFTLKENGSEPDVDPAHTIEPNAIGFRNAAFSWNGVQDQKEDIPTRRLYRLKIEGELFFKRRSLNLIIGPTGSGKTSLLMALLGEMHFEPNGEKAGFRLPRDGGVAYAAQETWVQNETIKVNILFGKPYDKERYDKVVYQCGLERDISLFEAGDETEVGEKGLTLSGGQKARITLARAVYSDAAIILLDDILAALDVHTARFIVEKCLQGDLLKDRTTILVTHNIAMVAPIAHFAVSLSLDGRVVSQGTVSEAMAKNQTFLRQVAETNEITEKVEETVDNVEFNKKDQNAVSKLVMEEEIALGHVGWPALKLYFSSLGGAGFWMAFVGGVFFVELLVNLSTWFLGFWASQYENHPVWAVPVSYYLSMYSVILASTMFVFSVSMVLFVFGSIKASRTIHRKLITSVLGTTLRWLDTVPTARIIARCTQDIRAVDGPLSQHLSDVIEITLALIVKFGAVILFVPMFVLPGLATFVAGGICGQLYIKAQLSVKREMSNRRSPVLAHFGAAISGLTSLRAYGAQNAFKTESLKRINGYTRPARTFYNCNRWVGIRIDAIGGTFAAGLAAYLVYDEGLRTVSNAGFSLTMAVGFSGLVLWWIRVLNEFEVHGNSLERIEDYVEIDQEPQATDAGKPPAYWPASGDLTVENLRARYSADGPEVLHDISFEVRSGERIGVVGRTGSGKSSLTLSLLRCIPTEGRVFYGGLAIHSINLDILRSNITIIPQQPELLSGTLRENLDPFSEHTDATLNDALRAAGLFNLQGENDASKITLDSSVSSGGGNLSVGQRQILALARAIVRRSKLLILDEATSAIDYATDTIIQTTLREVLKDATLITVAHRLQTIMDADKILVLDAGNMVEFDSPANLLKKDDGYLKSLVDESGDRDMLYKMAEKVGCSSK
ncbi:P-loop containing nucleoside triphosphate hydrolase protein [Ramaria rubella]|nr:P-loop containing nucleoside triphosphate hydrolase protein [Ramaria rubella]